ncbi:MAG: 4Fe-4S ferredoxin, partial [Promethearchaeota archaeon]
MSDDVYIKLRAYLDQFPLGYPKTSSGVELKILERLFSEEEAKIAVNLTPIPEEAAKIAKKIG